MTSRVVDITPSVLQWARERLHYEPFDVAGKLHVPVARYDAWERGAAKPTLRQLRELARTLRQSMGTFYLSEPPKDPGPLKELRRLPGASERRESPALAVQVYEAIERREVALSLLRDLGEEPAGPMMPVNTRDDPDELAASLREKLGVTTEQQARWRNPSEALDAWRQVLEEQGILVFQIPRVSLSEMRGLALLRAPLPIICVNSKDAVRGRTFTLLHEFGHILLRDSVLHGAGQPLYQMAPDQGRESFCNRLAAAILVPKDDLVGQTESMGKRGESVWSDREVGALEKRYSASKSVLVRRLRDLQLITRPCYDSLRSLYDGFRPGKTVERGGGDPYRNLLSHVGTLLPKLAFRAYYNEKITMSDLSAILHLKVQNLAKLEARVTGLEYALGA